MSMGRNPPRFSQKIAQNCRRVSDALGSRVAAVSAVLFCCLLLLLCAAKCAVQCALRSFNLQKYVRGRGILSKVKKVNKSSDSRFSIN
jgi:hypothetical protein